MSAERNIIDELREKIMLAALQSQRGVILQPGAIGDCILTLPLAGLMKETVCRGGVDIIGHTEHIGILPGRSCVDKVRSMESIDLHRLFADRQDFELADPDESGLISAFADYAWIVTFLGEANSDFEWNLIFTAHCSHSAEVITLAMKPGSPQADSTLRPSSGQTSSPQAGGDIHISEFYKNQFVEQFPDAIGSARHNGEACMTLIKPTDADIYRGKEILAEAGVMPTREPVIIHPGSGGAHKCWHLDNYVSVAKMLEQEGIDVVFLLGPAEVERFGQEELAKISAVGRLVADLTLADVVAVLSCAAGYVGNDSGITHLAAALGVRTVAVFGPTDPAVYGPVGPAVTVLRGSNENFTHTISEELQQKILQAIS